MDSIMDEKINGIVARVLKLQMDAVADGLQIGDVASWDSMSHMDLIVSIEEAFDLRFTGDEIADMTQIGRIRSLVKSRMRN